MSVSFERPLCLDPIHRPPAPESPAGPAVAIVRRQYAHSQWTVRCAPCVTRLVHNLGGHPTAHVKVFYLDRETTYV